MDQPTYEVGELADLLSRTFEEIFPDDIWIVGEISNLTRSQAGHVYFDLVQPGAVPGQAATARLSVVLFQATRTIVNKLLTRAGGIRMTDGMEVRIRGVVDFYPPQGRLQIRMTSVDPTYTLGKIALERDRLLKRLHADGIVARQQMRQLTIAPQRVGLITSEGSAAEHDFLRELEASGYSLHVHALHTRVQGNGAHLGLRAAVEHLSTIELDVLVIARGGGAKGDLAPFDAEELAIAIADCPHPVITGIGHEVDRTIADEVAHLSLKTPTACATLLVERLRQLDTELAVKGAAVAASGRRSMQTARARLDGRADQYRNRSHSSLDRADARLAATAQNVQGRATRAIAVADATLRARAEKTQRQATGSLRHQQRGLSSRATQLGPRATRALRWATRELELVESRVKALDPAASFARGWSVTRRTDGSVVRELGSVGDGDVIITQVTDGKIQSRVERNGRNDG